MGGFAEGGVGFVGGGAVEVSARGDAAGGAGEAASDLELSGDGGALDSSAMNPMDRLRTCVSTSQQANAVSILREWPLKGYAN